MKVLTPFMKYDYGNPLRGESLEKQAFIPALESIAEVRTFWLEDHGYPSNIEGLQQAIIKEAECFNPDIIFFILIKDEISQATIKYLRQHWITINWFCDDQWRFETFTRFIAPLFNYSITVDKYSIHKYQEIGCEHVIFSQWACNYIPNIVFNNIYEYEVCFIGGRNGVRDWYVQELKNNGINVTCFGAGWPNGRISYSKIQIIMQKSKICLNLSNSQPRDISYYFYINKRLVQSIFGKNALKISYCRSVYTAASDLYNLIFSKKRAEQIKARNFEIPAWGGFQISQFAIGIEEYFIPGKEIILYSNIEELSQLIKYYLVNSKEREDIRVAGYKRAASNTYTSRMKSIIKRIKDDQGMYSCP